MAKRSKKPEARRALRVYFKEWRQFRNLTQQQLADRLGTSKTRISMKERGEEGWDDRFLAALSDALGVYPPASLIMRNPLEIDAVWSLQEHLQKAGPDARQRILSVVETLLKTG